MNTDHIIVPSLHQWSGNKPPRANGIQPLQVNICGIEFVLEEIYSAFFEAFNTESYHFI